MTDCKEILPLLGFFEDSELEPHEMQEVARHLAFCKICEGMLSDYGAIGRQLRAVAIEPSLTNFAASVQRRLDQIPVPIRTRFARYWENVTERWTAGLAVTAAAMAAVAWLLLFAPYVEHYLGMGVSASHHPDDVASKPENETLAKSGNQPSAQNPVENPEPDEPQIARNGMPVEENPQTVISKLEARTPNVAVWSEPETKTTVIWVPDAK
jgi:hypothetical protein